MTAGPVRHRGRTGRGRGRASREGDQVVVPSRDLSGPRAGRRDQGLRRAAAGARAARGVLHRPAGRAGGDRRTVRVGQVDAPARHGDARAADRAASSGSAASTRRGSSDRELSLLRAREIGFVFQQFFLAEHATVRENVADGLLYAGVPAAERHRRADEALERGRARRTARRFRPHQALGRRAPAGGDRPGARRAAGDRARRRADRQPRQHHRRVDRGAAPRAQRRRRDDHHDHARRRPRRSAAAPDPDARRPGRLRRRPAP